MISGRIWPYFILIIVFLITPSEAQRFPFRNYNVREGLTQSQVQSIFQDRQGYLWIGTRDGLAVFDGRQFNNFTTRDGLEANYIHTSLFDSDQYIWIAYRTHGLSKLNTLSRKITPVEVTPELTTVQIDDIIEDANGRYWFATGGKGVFCLDDTTWRNFSKPDGLIDNNAKCLAFRNNSELWIGTEKGVTILSMEGQDLENKQNIESVTILNGLNISDILVDVDKNIWIGTENSGVYFVSGIQTDIKIFNTTNGLSSNVIQVIFQDSKHRIWIGTRGGGVSVISDPETGQILHLSEEHGLSYRDVLSIFEDREGSIWIGTNGGGLCQFRDRRFEFYSLQEGLPDKTIWAIIEDRNGQFWFGSEQGLVRYRPDSLKDGLNIKTFSQKEGLADLEISSLYEDKKGYLWVGLARSGVQVFNPRTNRFGRHLSKITHDVLSIVEDQNNILWFGTNGEGLYRYNRTTNQLQHFGPEDGLTSNYIFSLLVDKKGHLWIASAKDGLSRYDGQSFYKFATEDGFDAISIVCLVEDLDGQIWIGTEDKGLYCYDGTGFTNYTSKDGLSGDAAYSLVCDNDNNIWQGTRRGIERFNPKTKQTKIYGQYEGFDAVETNQNAVWKDKSGCLWFGTLDGVIRYNPAEDHFNTSEPEIRITDVGIFYHELESQTPHEFSYRENHLTFKFIGLSFVAPEKIRYKYILEGLEEEWSPETPDNYARYTNLSPGVYSFKVLAKNNDGIWSSRPANYPFEIASPFWQTAWFYLLVILIIAASVFTEHKRRVKRIERTNVILEESVQERTHALVAEQEKTQDAYRALLESEEKYKTFITYSTEAIWSIEFKNPISTTLSNIEQIDDFYSSGFLAECNQAMTGLYGYESVDQMIGLPLEKLLARDNPRNIEYLQKFIMSDYRIMDEESYEIDHNGKLRVFLNSLVGIVENKKLLRAWGLQRDITEKKHAEDALKESEERYRRLIELSPDAILVHSEKKIEYINRAGLKLLGALRQKDLVGKSIFGMIHPNYLKEAREKIKNIFKGKRPFRNLEQKMICQDGTIIDVELIGAPMSFQGEIAGQIVIRDITERKLAENAVMEEKERLDVTLSSIEDAVITTDVKGFIVLLNDRARQMLDFEEGAGVGFRFPDVVRIVDNKGPVQLLEDVMKHKKPVAMVKDIVLESGSGEKYQIELSAAPIKNHEGKLFGMVAAIRDVTTKKQIEAELTKAQKLESIGVLAGGIAHDFNNFLTAILGNVSLAKMYSTDNAKINPILARAEKAIIQAKELTHQLLTFSKGGAPLKKTTSIVDVIQDSAKFTLRGSDIYCEVKSTDNLWNVVVDAGQISQVVQNLILNAVQSMKKSKKIFVRIENNNLVDDEYPGLEGGKYVKISIIDQGGGIPERDLIKIFDPYFTTKPQGTGLGLTTTYSIIKQHEGYINVKSQVGKGTTVELFLPATEKKAKIEKNIKPVVHNGRGKILVMDDDIMVRELLSQILDHLGYEVDEAENGETTLEKYKTAKSNGDPIDLIIMDLTIPGGMGGKETIKELIKVDPEVKAIVSSGYSNDPIMAKFNDYGFIGVLNKPYNVETLSDALSQFFNNNSSV